MKKILTKTWLLTVITAILSWGGGKTQALTPINNNLNELVSTISNSDDNLSSSKTFSSSENSFLENPISDNPSVEKTTAGENYLTFTANEISSVGIENNGDNSPDVKYSINGGTWKNFVSGTSISLSAGDVMRVKGNNSSGFSISSSKYTRFTITGNVSASGSVMSLIDGKGKSTTIPNDGCFYYLFKNCKGLTTAPELPATTLASTCYCKMFLNCVSLTTAPKLPATTLARFCYDSMFEGCTSLTTAPDILPATTLANYCYSSMFEGCTSLTTAPDILPATTLAERCYSSMFEGCTSLTTAPKLPATTLASYCYLFMFKGCTGLTLAPELPATTLADHCYSDMFLAQVLPLFDITFYVSIT